jgi:large subunit ribosomal protein L9
MDVILLTKVTNLGGLGDRVKVRNGYGRNFLIPHGKALPASEANIKMFEERRAELERKANDELSAAQDRATKLAELGAVSIAAKAGDEGKLFGSVGTRDIATAVSDAGVAVKKSEILMPAGPIRHIGEYAIEVQLHSDVRAEVKIAVVAE